MREFIYADATLNAIQDTYQFTHAKVTQAVTELQIPQEKVQFALDAWDHMDAWDYVKNTLQSVSPAEVEVKHLLHLHSLLMQRSPPELTPGQFRAGDGVMYIPGTSFIAPLNEEVPAMMNKFVKWMRESATIIQSNERGKLRECQSADWTRLSFLVGKSTPCLNCVVHPVLFAALAHLNFVSIHPFQDGNGRMSRLIVNWILIHYGYEPIYIHADTRPVYFKHLRGAQYQDPNLSPNVIPFVTFMAEQFVLSSDWFITKVSRVVEHARLALEYEKEFKQEQEQQQLKNKQKENERRFPALVPFYFHHPCWIIVIIVIVDVNYKAYTSISAFS